MRKAIVVLLAALIFGGNAIASYGQDFVPLPEIVPLPTPTDLVPLPEIVLDDAPEDLVPLPGVYPDDVFVLPVIEE